MLPEVLPTKDLNQLDGEEVSEEAVWTVPLLPLSYLTHTMHRPITTIDSLDFEAHVCSYGIFVMSFSLLHVLYAVYIDLLCMLLPQSIKLQFK